MVQAVFCIISSVRVIPFQTQSMLLPSSSTILVSQLISTKSGSTPNFSQTAVASSVSKPVKLPSASV